MNDNYDIKRDYIRISPNTYTYCYLENNFVKENYRIKSDCICHQNSKNTSQCTTTTCIYQRSHVHITCAWIQYHLQSHNAPQITQLILPRFFSYLGPLSAFGHQLTTKKNNNRLKVPRGVGTDFEKQHRWQTMRRRPDGRLSPSMTRTPTDKCRKYQNCLQVPRQ